MLKKFDCVWSGLPTENEMAEMDLPFGVQKSEKVYRLLKLHAIATWCQNAKFERTNLKPHITNYTYDSTSQLYYKMCECFQDEVWIFWPLTSIRQKLIWSTLEDTTRERSIVWNLYNWLGDSTIMIVETKTLHYDFSLFELQCKRLLTRI